MKNWKSTLQILLFLSIGIAVVVVFWLRMPAEQQAQFRISIKQAKPEFLLLSMLFGTLANFVRALRWGLLLEPFQYKPKTHNLFFAVLNMYFFNLLVPRLGEITRCGILQRYEKIPLERGLGSVVAERTIDMLMLLLIMGGTFLWQWEYLPGIFEALQKTESQSEETTSSFPYLILGGLVSVLAGVTLFLMRNHPKVAKIYLKLIQLLRGFWEGLKSVLRLKKTGRFSIYTLFIWGFYLAMTHVCFYALPDIHSGPEATFAIVAFGSVAIIIVPGGVGVFPVIVATIMAQKHLGGLEEGLGLALGWLMWAAQIAMILVAGAISIVILPLINPKS
jgi:uncharacterized membrane protein YbhN (UPF0104 family)